MTRRDSVNAIKSLAVRSGQWISMDPDRWGEHHLDDLEEQLQWFLPQIPEELRSELEAKYIAKYSEWLHCLSRCFSVMITGGAGFNNRRHQKTNDAEQNAYNRLVAWREKVIKRLNRQERLTGWAEVERLTQKLEELQALQEKMKAANKIVRSKKLADVEKIDELVSLGFTEKNAITLNSEPEYSFLGKGFPRYQLTNNLARIKATEEAIKSHTTMAATEDTETDYPWGTLIMCYSEERIRFVFTDIPSPEVRNKLKSNAFKWSPKNQAWQRQMTVNAKYATRELLKEI